MCFHIHLGLDTQIDFLAYSHTETKKKEIGGVILIEKLKHLQHIVVEVTLLILVVTHSVDYIKYAIGI